MTESVQHLLSSFDALSESEKHEAAVELLRRIQQDAPLVISDETLVASADESFVEFDACEAENTRPDRGEDWPLRIRLLIGSHILLAGAGTLFWSLASPMNLLLAIVTGVFLAQACLVGVWLGIGRVDVSRKSVLATAGLLCLGGSMALAGATADGQIANVAKHVADSLPLVVVLALATAASLLIARRRTDAVLLGHWSMDRDHREGFQFTLRHLLLVTTFVAFLLGMRTAASQFFLDAERTIGSVVQLLLLGIAWAVPVLAIAWATLGTKRPHERMAAAMALALSVAVLLPLYFGADWQSQRFHGIVLMTASMFVVVALSLLIVRSAGYRLVGQCLQVPSATGRGDFDNSPVDS